MGTVPILDATFGLPTPTDTKFSTTDIAFQYDGVADFPEYPINVLADLNAVAGFAYIHPTYLTPNESSDALPDGYTRDELLAAEADPNNRVTVGDTVYITIPTRTLPILLPLIAVGQATGTSAVVTPVVDLVSPTLRVLIDTGYDPNANPGEPTPFKLIPPVKPATLAADLSTAAVEGMHAAAGDLSAPPVAKDPVPLIPPVLTVTRPSATASTVTAARPLKPAANSVKPKPLKVARPVRAALHHLTSALSHSVTKKTEKDDKTEPADK